MSTTSPFTNHILVQAQSKTGQIAALRVLFDCFYGSSGFAPWYHRDECNEEGGHSLSESWLFRVVKGKAKPEHDDWTAEEKKKYIRYDAVMSYLGRMSDITKEDVPYLVGRKSGYDELHKSHHSQSVRVVAMQVDKLTKKFPSEKRRAVILKMFCHLTGYSSYGDAL